MMNTLLTPYLSWADFDSVIPANTEYAIRIVAKTSKKYPPETSFTLFGQLPDVIFGVNDAGNIELYSPAIQGYVDTGLAFPTDANWHSYTLQTTASTTTVTIDVNTAVTIPSIGLVSDASGPLTIGDPDINNPAFYGWFSETRVYTGESDLVFYVNFGTGLVKDLVSGNDLSLSGNTKIDQMPTFTLDLTKGGSVQASKGSLLESGSNYVVTLDAAAAKTPPGTFGLLSQNDGQGNGVDLLWVKDGKIQIGTWNTNVAFPDDTNLHEYVVMMRPGHPDALFLDGDQVASSDDAITVPPGEMPFFIGSSLDKNIAGFQGVIPLVEIDSVQSADGFAPNALWDFTPPNWDPINLITSEVGQLLGNASIGPLGQNLVLTRRAPAASLDNKYITATARSYALVVTLSDQATKDVINGANILSQLTDAIAKALAETPATAVASAAISIVSNFLWASSVVLGLVNTGKGVDLVIPWSSFWPIFPPLGPGGVIVPLPAGMGVGGTDSARVLTVPE